MFARVAICVALGAGVTLALFLLMQMLIASNREGELEEDKSRNIEFVRAQKKQELTTKTNQARRPVASKKPPPPPIQPAVVPPPSFNPLDIDSVGIDPIALQGGINTGGAVADTAPIPLVRIPPMYPERAASRGIKGWVMIRFTITAAGTVADPEIVDADPPSMFNRSALRAIRRWKYKPKIVDGKPVPQVGVQTMISFELEDDRRRGRR